MVLVMVVQVPLHVVVFLEIIKLTFLIVLLLNIGISYTLSAEIMGVILAIRLAHEKCWTHL